MQYTAVRNCKWANAEHSSIECEVNFSTVTSEEWSPFGANPNDHYEHGREIYARAVAGDFGTVEEYVAPPPPVVNIPDPEPTSETPAP
jgi:hypothetical protein